MNPPTEQLIRDYLNRVSVAARGRLSADDRRAFLARTREFIEQNTRAVGHTDSADVLELLAGLGDPAVLVARERDRLAAQRTGTGGGDSASGARSTRAWRWRPARGSLADLMAARATPVSPGQGAEVPEPGPDVPLTGELQFQTRPITSRWRPGAAMVPKPPRQRRAGIPRRLQPDGGPSDSPPPAGVPSAGPPAGVPSGNAQEHPAPPPQVAGTADRQSAGPPPPPAEPPLPADARSRFRRPEWPLLSPRRPDAGGTVPANGQPPGGADALFNGQARSNGAQSSQAQPDATQPDGAHPGGGESTGTGTNGLSATGRVEANGTQSNGTMPKEPQPGAVPAQRTPPDAPQPVAQPGGGPPEAPQPAGQPSQAQPPATNAGPVSSGAAPGTSAPPGSAPAGGGPADDPSAGGVSSSDLVAGRAPGSRRLAAVARGTGWASGVRARGARAVAGHGVGRGTGRSGRTGKVGTTESGRQQGSPPAEEPLSGLWPDLGPIGAGAGRLARTVLARARRRPLEATAVVLLGLGGLIYPPVWLMGAAVALVSRVWDIRDKWVGLAVPVFLVIVGMIAAVALGGTRSGLSGYAREAWIFGSHFSRVAAVLGAVYLTWRAERGRRSPPVAPWNKPRRFG